MFPNKFGKKHNELRMVVVSIARNYIPEVTRLGPHALRHIVATDFLKRNPEKYIALAELLHDNLETVLEEYAHDKRESAFAAHETSLQTFFSGI